MFPPIEYLEWIDGRPERAAYDLGSSDLRAPGNDGLSARYPTESDDPVGDLRSLVADEYGVDRANVLLAAGTTHANFLAMATALGMDETDELSAVVERPGYEPLVATPEGLGARVRRFDRPAEDGYCLDPEAVREVVDDRTSAIVASNRHNPSGRLADRDTLASVARVAESVGATLLVDEVYAPFTLDQRDGPFGGPTAAGLPNAVISNSVTKFFGLGPVRVGWLVGPEEFVDRARLVGWHVPVVAEPSVELAAGVLERRDVWSERSRAVLAQNFQILSTFVEDHPDLSGFVAPGNSFAFLAHERADGDAVVRAAWEEGVLVVPGRFFDDPGRFRVSLGRDPRVVEEGLAVLGEVLDDL